MSAPSNTQPQAPRGIPLVRDAVKLGLQKAGPFLSATATKVQQRLPLVLRGVACASIGIRSTMMNQELHAAFYGFAAEYIVYVIGLYVAFFGLAFTVLSPIAALLLFLSPGTLVQILLLIPHLAFTFTYDRNPQRFDNILLTELRRLDPAYADRLAEALVQPNVEQQRHFNRFGVGNKIMNRVRNSWLFSRRSLQLAVVGMIPVVGSLVSSVGEATIVAESLGTTLLEPFIFSRGWDARTRNEFIDRYRWIIVGWALPFALLQAIPVVGGFFMVLAQGATAHLIYRELAPPEGRRDQASGEVTKEVEWINRAATAAISSVPAHLVGKVGTVAAEYLGAGSVVDGLRRRIVTGAQTAEAPQVTTLPRPDLTKGNIPADKTTPNLPQFAGTADTMSQHPGESAAQYRPVQPTQ